MAKTRVSERWIAERVLVDADKVAALLDRRLKNGWVTFGSSGPIPARKQPKNGSVRVFFNFRKRIS